MHRTSHIALHLCHRERVFKPKWPWTCTSAAAKLLINGNSTQLNTCIVCFQDRIDSTAQAADQFVAAGHFDADNIKAKQLQLAERFRALNDPMQARRQKLRDALRLQQFYRDVEDEEDWIREKEPIAASANRG